MKRFLYVLPCLVLLMMSASAQEILFDFEDAAQGEQWEQLAGFWDVYEGFFTEIDDAGGPIVVSTDGLGVENYTLIVQAMGLVADADWGLAFHIQDINNHYSWQFVNGGIAFIKYVDGTRTSLFNEALAEELEVWQEFKVVVNGSTFECYFDGELKTTIVDEDLPIGQIGLFSWVNGGSDLGEKVGFVAFDNFLATAQEEWSISRSAPSDTYRQGQTLNGISITVEPQAGSTLSQVIITETYPTELSVSNLEPAGTVDAGAGTITWTLSNVSEAQTVSYSLQAPDTTDFGSIALRAKADDGTIVRNAPRVDLVLSVDSVPLGEEIFFDFEDAAQDEQWADLAGDWGIQDGQFYEFADADGPLVAVTGDPNVTDYTITVDSMGLVTGADWGIVFRCQDIDNHYSWQFVNETLQVIRYLGGARSSLFSLDQAEVLNEWQLFRVDVQGDTFNCYVDGELITTVTDNTLPFGQIGLFGWVNGGSPVAEAIGGIVYDNFRATAPTDVEVWMMY